MKALSFLAVSWLVTVNLGTIWAQEESAPELSAPLPQGKMEERKPPSVEKMREEREAAAKRILEINKILDPVENRLALKLFGFDETEYRALRAQAENPQVGADFFAKFRRVYTASLDGAALFFDEAYASMSKGQFWFGREEELVQKDAALFAEIQAAIVDEIRRLPEGEELIKLMAERSELRRSVEVSGPMFEYLSERRNWWKAYPAYLQTIREQTSTP
jgi:hypothetical protein